MSRKTTNQATQRARVKHRRRFRGPVVFPLQRSQSGQRLDEYLNAKAGAVMLARMLERRKAGWRARAAEKAAKP